MCFTLSPSPSPSFSFYSSLFLSLPVSLSPSLSLGGILVPSRSKLWDLTSFTTRTATHNATHTLKPLTMVVILWNWHNSCQFSQLLSAFATVTIGVCLWARDLIQNTLQVSRQLSACWIVIGWNELLVLKCSNTLQHIATHCNTLQHAATRITFSLVSWLNS